MKKTTPTASRLAQKEKERIVAYKAKYGYDLITESTYDQTTDTLIKAVSVELDCEGIELGSELADIINAIARGEMSEAFHALLERSSNSRNGI